MGELAVIIQAEYAGPCHTCGVPVWLPESRFKICKADEKQSFYCCNGHSLVFRDSEAVKLRRELEQERSRREQAEREAKSARHSAATARGKLNAAKTRIGNGVCPCCNRTFQNLMRHMQTKHPDFKNAEVVQLDEHRKALS
jgi:DNA repair exonuclease SbcCD ATPase subunit